MNLKISWISTEPHIEMIRCDDVRRRLRSRLKHIDAFPVETACYEQATVPGGQGSQSEVCLHLTQG
jgi:hypothetical protein